MNNSSNRDLLILFNQELMTPQAIEREVEGLHKILFLVEQIDNLIIAHEAIDINRYKIFKKSVQLRNIFCQNSCTPFVFLNCNN